MRPALGVAGLGVLLVLVAGTFDAPALYVAATAFVVLGGGCAGWVWLAARGVRVRRTLGARRVVEEEPLDVRVHVRAGRVGLPGGWLHDEVLGDHPDLALGLRGTRVRINTRFGRRGRRTLPPPRVVVRDPLGLAERVVTDTTAEPDEVLVLPRVEPVRWHEAGGSRGRARRSGRAAIAAEVELDGVREHRQGTPASRIYWPALARGAGLMERRLRAETDATPLIVLDARGAATPELEEGLDAAVRATASLVVAVGQSSGVAVLLPGDRRPTVIDPSLGGWPHLHARLAVVELGGRPALHALGSRIGSVLYVSAAPLGRTPRALAEAPASARILVVPGTLAGRRPAFSVAGCHGYDLEPARAPRSVPGAVA